MGLHRTLAKLGRIHKLLIVFLLSVIFIIAIRLNVPAAGGEDFPGGHPARISARSQLSIQDYKYEPHGDLVTYKKDVPLIWIGGVPRSGTTLMRAMLDAHPMIRCGEETRVIPRILGMHQGMSKSETEMTRLREAKITSDVLSDAQAAYILSIIANHGDPAPRLCNKDPFTLRSMQKLLGMFPYSKFILMLRDGRATVHSIVSRHVTIKGFDVKTYRGGLRDWNKAISSMYTECLTVGPKICLQVHYENLVLKPKSEMKRILQFLDVPWDPIVVHHELAIGQKDGISLSKRELSTDQVNKPVNTEALTKWVEHIPDDVRADIRQIAPMLETLGYNPDGYPPSYGTPETRGDIHSDIDQHNQLLQKLGLKVNEDPSSQQ